MMNKDSRLENQEKWTGKSGDGWSVAKFRERIRARLVNVLKVRRGIRKFWSSSRSTAATTGLVSTRLDVAIPARKAAHGLAPWHGRETRHDISGYTISPGGNGGMSVR
jgi:hypothetical protein